MLKQKVWLMVTMIISILMFMGCGDVNWVTPNGKPVPDALSSSVSFLHYSGQFSKTTAQVSNRLLEAGDITQEEWDTMKKAWEEHKKYHNLLQEEVVALYKEVVSGELEVGYTNIILNYMKVILSNGDLINGILNRVIEDSTKIEIPKNLFMNMMKFYKVIKGDGGNLNGFE